MAFLCLLILSSYLLADEVDKLIEEAGAPARKVEPSEVKAKKYPHEILYGSRSSNFPQKRS